METIDFNTVITENISVVEGLLPVANRDKKGLLSSTDYSRTVPLYAETFGKATVYKIVGNTSGILPMSSILISGSKNAVPVLIEVAINNATIRAEKLTDDSFSLYKNGVDIYVEVQTYSFISVVFQRPSSSDTIFQLTESNVDVSSLTKIL